MRSVLEDLKLAAGYDGMIFLAESKRNPPLLKPHCHVELEVNLVTRGTVTYVISGERHTFSRGSLIWIFPSQEHQLVDRTADAGYYVAVFTPALVERACHSDKYEALKTQSLEGKRLLSRLLDTASMETLVPVMDSLMEDALDPDVLNSQAGFGIQPGFRFEHGDPDALNAGLHYLLIFCWRAFLAGAQSNQSVRLHPAVRKSLKLLEQPDNPSNLRQVATQCGLSETYLSRLFLQQIGVTMTHYKNSVRLRRFMEVFNGPEKRTLLEAVFEAGFGSYAQFFKVFVQTYGKGPRAYLNGGEGEAPAESAGRAS